MTEDEDFSYYYNENETDAKPCNNVNAKASIQVFLPTLYSIVFITGFFGNGLVVWVLIRYRHKSNMTDVCLLNLAISDLLFLVSLPFWAHAAMADWIFGKFMCHTVTGLYMLGLYGSIFFMLLMTLDRYVIILHPNSIFFRNRSGKIGLTLVLCVWTLSLFAALPNIIFVHEHNETKDLILCISKYPDGWKSFAYLKLNLLSLFLPLIIMGYCYAQVIRTLRRIKSQKRHRVIRLILAVVAVYFLFWTPYNIAIFMRFLQTKGYLLSCEWVTGLNMAMQWVETIAFSHCCLNPIIYGFVGEKFRGAVIMLVMELFPISFRQCAFSQVI